MYGCIWVRIFIEYLCYTLFWSHYILLIADIGNLECLEASRGAAARGVTAKPGCGFDPHSRR